MGKSTVQSSADAIVSRLATVDRDRVIRAALDVLETVAIDTVHAGDTFHRVPRFNADALNYVAGISDIPVDRFADARERAAYVRELLLGIRAKLSPLSA